jgi:hypothetical protein
MNERLLEAPERFSVTKLSPLHPDLPEAEALGSGATHPDELPTEMMRSGVLFPDHIAIIEHFLKEKSTEPTAAGEGSTPQGEHMKLKPGNFGTKNGLPAISWWRYGRAAAGEPRVVTEVRTYPDEQARYDAYFKKTP